jgi:hypothetical protein
VGNTLPEQLLKRKYDSRTKVENLALVDTGFLQKVSRSVGPDGDSFTSFIQLSGGVAWAGTRQGARAIAGQGGRRGNGSFQAIKNSAGCLKGECEVRERDVARANSADASALRAIAATVDGHLAQFGQTVEWMAMGVSEGMSICTGSIVDGVIALSVPEHVTRIRQDMLLVASATAGTSGSALGGGSIGFVQRVGRLGTAPTVSVSPTSGGAIATPAGWTESTTLFFFMYETYAPSNGGAGHDNQSDGDTSGFVFDTIESWNPSDRTGLATPFKTMVRSTEELLAGVVLSPTEVANLNILERIELLAVTGRSRAGWKKDSTIVAYVHTTRFNEAAQLLRTEDMRNRGFHMKDSGKAETGYKYIEITCIGADVRLEECPLYDTRICRMLNAEDWEIHSSHGFPQVVSDIDGLRWIRDKDNDTYVLQYSAYPSIRTRNPAMSAQCPLD